MTLLYQNEKIRQLEALAINEASISSQELMERAGKAAWEVVHEYYPDSPTIVVFCGKGNNAGDGYVLARYAFLANAAVSIYTLCDLADLQGDALKNYQECLALGIKLEQFNPQEPLRADVVVDAMLGTGLKGDVQEPFSQAIAAINEADAAVFSLDVPSGLNVDTGALHGSAVQADATITFIGMKPGLLTAKGPNFCGELFVDDLGIPRDLFQKVEAKAETLDWDAIQKYLPRRGRTTHKGDFGHVLVIGGDYGMGGAVRMASESAMRVGAGLVSVATRPEHVPVVNCERPEIMCHQVAEGSDLAELLEKATVVVIGPGLGKSDWAKSLFETVMKTNLPKVLDADCLNLLSEAPRQCDEWILTPHPGEAGRLLGMTSQDVQSNRFDAAAKLQETFGGVVALKGAGTIVQSSGVARVCAAGNPGMATGGMGDVLSGVIGGLLAQKLSLKQAAEAGVMAHSMAADFAAAKGGERGLLATDLMSFLRDLVNPSSEAKS